MRFEPSKKNDKYQWTQHSLMKMQYYGLSQQRIKRVIKSPQRIEEGIVENTIAVMQPASTRGNRLSTRGGPTSTHTKNGKKTWTSEIWVMYQIRPAKSAVGCGLPKAEFNRVKSKSKLLNIPKQVKIISAWRYPGISPERDPVPQEILDEILNIEQK